MSDATVLAFIGLGTVVVAAVPATVTALMSRRTLVEARDHAATAADAASQARDTLGEINGDGAVTQMLARSLAELGQVLRNQETTAVMQSRLVELSAYTHREIHRINGQVGMMWRDWAKEHGIDIDDLPAPEPSPSRENP